jgi:uncharacterized protein YbaR (Trm112 family)
MTLPDTLLEKLACPQCHGTLNYFPDKNRLECRTCRLAFRVADDIPVLVLDEAEKMN